MEANRVFIFLIALVLILIAGGFIFGPRAQAPGVTPPVQTAQTIEAHDVFKDGVHTISGSIDLPTPCYALSATTTIAESFPEQVTLRFTITPPPADEFCAQVISPTPFTVKVPASQGASFVATVNGAPAHLALQKPAARPGDIIPNASSTIINASTSASVSQ